MSTIDRSVPACEIVAAELGKPLLLLGLRSQRLGFVDRLFVSLITREIVQVELRTPWQTLRLAGDLLVFDRQRRILCLVSKHSTLPTKSPVQALLSELSS